MNKLAMYIKEVESIFGIDACIAACDEIYSSVYKHPVPFTLQEHQSVNPGMESEIRSELREIVAEALAISAGTFNTLSTEEIEEIYEAGYDIDRSAVCEMYSAAETLLDNGIEFVHLVNYKGEDAGVMLLELSKNVRTYISKYNYE